MNNNKEKVIYDFWLVWTITNACNLNCAYCNASDPRRIVRKFYSLGFLNSSKVVTANLGKLIQQIAQRGAVPVFRETKAKLTYKTTAGIDIKALMRTLEESQKVFKISFTGGEPFLVPNFIETCKSITQKHFITIVSNLTSHQIKSFSETIDPRKVLEICASLHIEELEKRRLLDRYIENVELLKDEGFNVTAQAVAYPTLLSEVEKYRAYFKEQGIDIAFVPFRGRYRWKQYPKAYTGEEIERFEFGSFSKSHTDIMTCFYRKGEICNAGFNVGVVFPSGDAQTCFLIDQRLGNVFTKIEFNKNLIKCPFKYCSCPLNFYDPGLFDKALKENNLF